MFNMCDGYCEPFCRCREKELQRENFNLRAQVKKQQKVLRAVASLAGSRAHRVGCQCGGKDTLDGYTCREVWTMLEVILNEQK